jgi:hypothetical protein
VQEFDNIYDKEITKRYTNNHKYSVYLPKEKILEKEKLEQ